MTTGRTEPSGQPPRAYWCARCERELNDETRIEVRGLTYCARCLPGVRRG